jgi:hypothetical protein
LPKFSQRLKFSEARKNKAFTVSALTGRSIPEAVNRIKASEIDANWESQRTALKCLDWSETPIYQLYKLAQSELSKEGKLSRATVKTEQVIEQYAENNFMYTDVELQYFASTITKSLSTHKSVVSPPAPFE